MNDKEIIKLAHKLHYIYWANIFREVLHWTWDWDVNSITTIKKSVRKKLFPGFRIISNCFSCHGAREAGLPSVNCENCFLDLGHICPMPEYYIYGKYGNYTYNSAWGYILYAKSSKEALPYVKQIRDAKIKWDINIGLAASNLRPLMNKIILEVFPGIWIVPQRRGNDS